jgi:hypothetical protein
MENQINVGDQNTQQVGQNPVSQPVQIPEKPRINYWMISTIVLLIVAISGGFYIASLRNQINIVSSSQDNQPPTQIPTVLSPTNTPMPTSQPIVTEQPKVEWTRKQFATAWDIEFPKGWEIHEEGLIEGNIWIKGNYGGNIYQIGMGYPIALGYNIPDEVLPENITLDQWVEHEISFVPANLKTGIKTENTTIANTPSKIVMDFPEKTYDDGKTKKYSDKLTHAAYIWKQGDKNQRVVSIKLVSGAFDSKAMETFFRDFLTRIR